MNLASLVKKIREMLAAAGVPSPEVDADLLVALATGLTRSEVRFHAGRGLSEEQTERALELARRRAERVPLQIISGEVEFYSARFHVRHGVYIPRPETETLVDQVLGRVGRECRLRLLELCTGSGVVGISLAIHFPGARVTAADISLDAVELAKENAIINRVASRMDFIVGDGLSFIDTGGKGRGLFDVVVFNPPYVESGTIDGLEPEVKDHDPRIALDGGPDGLDFIEGIMPPVASVLKEGGLLAFEIGSKQGDRAVEIVESCGLRPEGIVRDLAGLDRVALGRKPSG